MPNSSSPLRVHLLGTGAALSGPERTTTMLAVEKGRSLYLIDCGGDAAQRALKQGFDLARISGLIVTHEHADHAGGFPLLMERLWLAGRRAAFPVYGNRSALAQIRRLYEAFDTAEWEGYPAVAYQEVQEHEGAPVLSDENLTITAAHGIHAVPAIGVRVECSDGRVAAYSGDTAFSPAITRLARGAHLLIHEATGEGDGHSSAAQAAQVAVKAQAHRLALVHLPPLTDAGEALLREARALFGETELGYDGAKYVV